MKLEALRVLSLAQASPPPAEADQVPGGNNSSRSSSSNNNNNNNKCPLNDTRAAPERSFACPAGPFVSAVGPATSALLRPVRPATRPQLHIAGHH